MRGDFTVFVRIERAQRQRARCSCARVMQCACKVPMAFRSLVFTVPSGIPVRRRFQCRHLGGIGSMRIELIRQSREGANRRSLGDERRGLRVARDTGCFTRVDGGCEIGSPAVRAADRSRVRVSTISRRPPIALDRTTASRQTWANTSEQPRPDRADPAREGRGHNRRSVAVA
jgi:hypothetical protein